MSLEGKSVDELQKLLEEVQKKHNALGRMTINRNVGMKGPMRNDYKRQISEIEAAIQSKSKSWWNPFAGGRRSRRARGGGWSMGSMITPGFYENVKYAGAGMDCAGAPVRPGLLQSVSGAGLPYRSSGGKRSGKQGGKRGGKRRSRKSHHSMRKSRGGAATATGELYANHTISMPGVQIHAGAHTPGQVPQKGGRYEMSMGPLVGSGSDIGMRAPSMAHRISCEGGAPNSLNQHGGAFQAVHVGAADMMRYQAPNAGYSNQPLALPSGGASPGFLTQIPYAAGSMNRSCLTTGGKRSKRKQRK